MKNLKYTLFTAALSVAMTAGFSSCSDSFLDEKNKSSYTTDYFKTSQGIQDLATALYGNIRWHFGYEWAYGITPVSYTHLDVYKRQVKSYSIRSLKLMPPK